MHGSGNFYIRLIDLHGVCINFIEVAPDVLKSYLLFFIQKINDICLDNKCYNCVYFVFIPVFIEIPVFIRIYCSFYFYSTGMYLFNLYFYCIYWKCIYSVLFLFYIFNHICWVGSYFLLFNTCAIKFIEGKFYFEGRACYIGKIMPTCIE